MLRRRNSLGVHSGGAEFGSRFVSYPHAGRTWPWQRSPHEYTEPVWRKLEVAVRSRAVYVRVEREACAPCRSNGPIASAFSCSRGRRLCRLKSQLTPNCERNVKRLRRLCDSHRIVYRGYGEFSWRPNPLSKRGRLRSHTLSRTGRAFRWWGTRISPSSREKSSLCWAHPVAAS